MVMEGEQTLGGEHTVQVSYYKVVHLKCTQCYLTNVAPVKLVKKNKTNKKTKQLSNPGVVDQTVVQFLWSLTSYDFFKSQNHRSPLSTFTGLYQLSSVRAHALSGTREDPSNTELVHELHVVPCLWGMESGFPGQCLFWRIVSAQGSVYHA